jgi:1A family penicillin-binding protein
MVSTNKQNGRTTPLVAKIKAFILKGGLKKYALIGLIVFALIFIGLTIVMISLNDQLPDPNHLSNRQIYQSTKIYDSTGNHLLHEFYQDKKRTLVELENMSDWLPKAVVAVEDKHFYDHRGIRIISIVRAGFNNLIGRKAGSGGASTLTQQLIKNVLVGDERTLFRKIKEALLAIKAEQRYSKKDILKMYLNEIPLGSTNYGVESASQSYFQKNSKDLTLAESATIAALIQRPSSFLNNLEALKDRRNLVLRLMYEQGQISEEEKNSAQQTPLNLNRNNGLLAAPHFVFYVQDELEKILGDQDIATGGYRVFTTLDFDKQKLAEKVVKENGDKFAKENNANNACLVAIEPKTGNIVSMVGSRDYNNNDIDGQFNVVLSKNRQPGSSFKPFVYLAAFEKGYTPNTVLYDIKTDFDQRNGSRFSPKNANNKEYGQITMQKALQGSLNIPAVKTMYLVGFKDTIEFAKRFGYTTLDPNGDYGLSLVIGGAAIMPLEHTAAYAALANNGIYVAPHSILRVENDLGEVIYEKKDINGSKAVSPELATSMSNILANNSLRAYIFGTKNNLTLTDRPAAAKTGTTNDNKDAWTMGYVPSLAVGVWVGNTKPSPMIGGGERLAGIIWNQFMQGALKDTKPELFPPTPPQVTTEASKPIFNGVDEGLKLKINSLNGKIATSSTPPNVIVENTYILPHDILYYIDRNDPTGPQPLNPQDDPQFQAWENSLNAWILKNKEKGILFSTDPPPTEFDDAGSVSGSETVSLRITNPIPHQVVSDNSLNVTLEVSSTLGISQVSYSIDGVSVGNSKTAPFSFTVNTSQLKSGDHLLRIAAVDDYGNFATKEVVFSTISNQDTPSVEWFDLSPLTLKPSDFPRTMFLKVSQWDKIQEIKINLVSEGGESKLLYTIDKNDNFSDNKVYFVWKKPPTSGTYNLRATLTGTDFRTTEKDLLLYVR